MDQNLTYYLIYTISYGFILLMGEGMYRYLRIPEEKTRNFSHLSAGLVSIPYPWVFTSHWWVLLLAIQSSIVLLWTRSAGWFPSHHKSNAKIWGSPLFFASLYLCYLAYSLTQDVLFFLLPVMILSFSDMLASLAGRTFGKNPPAPWSKWMADGKTLQGSAAFLGSALCISSVLFYLTGEWNLETALFAGIGLAVLTTFTEALTSGEFDNLSIPAITLIVMFLYSMIL